jgi:hypothetical protein
VEAAERSSSLIWDCGGRPGRSSLPRRSKTVPATQHLSRDWWRPIPHQPLPWITGGSPGRPPDEIVSLADRAVKLQLEHDTHVVQVARGLGGQRARRSGLHGARSAKRWTASRGSARGALSPAQRQKCRVRSGRPRRNVGCGSFRTKRSRRWRPWGGRRQPCHSRGRQEGEKAGRWRRGWWAGGRYCGWRDDRQAAGRRGELCSWVMMASRSSPPRAALTWDCLGGIMP